MTAQNKNTLYIIRTNSADAAFQNLCKILKEYAPGKIVVVADERNGSVDTQGLEKISLNEPFLNNIGITTLPDNWGWLCGDMCHYAAASIFPDYNYYFLIESDVYIPRMSAADFFLKLENNKSSAIAASLKRYESTPKYSRALALLGIDSNWGCIFPITRVSSDMLRHMKSLRSRELHALPWRQLNDEAILAGAVAELNCSYEALDKIFPEYFSMVSGKFNTTTRWLFETLLKNQSDPNIYHSALCLDTILDGIRDGLPKYRYRRMRHIRKRASKEVLERMQAAYLLSPPEDMDARENIQCPADGDMQP